MAGWWGRRAPTNAERCGGHLPLDPHRGVSRQRLVVSPRDLPDRRADSRRIPRAASLSPCAGRKTGPPRSPWQEAPGLCEEGRDPPPDPSLVPFWCHVCQHGPGRDGRSGSKPPEFSGGIGRSGTRHHGSAPRPRTSDLRVGGFESRRARHAIPRRHGRQASENSQIRAHG